MLCAMQTCNLGNNDQKVEGHHFERIGIRTAVVRHQNYRCNYRGTIQLASIKQGLCERRCKCSNCELTKLHPGQLVESRTSKPCHTIKQK